MFDKFKVIGRAIFTQAKEPVAVVIPTHKSKFSDCEKISLERCIKILGAHPIIFALPEGLKLADIPVSKKGIKCEYFDKKYFQSGGAYNIFLMSTEFYERFLNYEYILIHQLDSFVFKDELLYWCDQGFDYIGAPWFSPSCDDAFWHMMNILKLTWLKRILQKLGYSLDKKVGNGGFSLRCTRKCIFALWPFRKDGVRFWKFGEDMFWTRFSKLYFPFLKIADWRSALKFSVETGPGKYQKIDESNPPFGCHAWMRPDKIHLWYSIFRKLGHDIQVYNYDQ